MEKLSLSFEEILFFAAGSGADRVYGIPDILSGISEEELNAAVMNASASLSQKGLLEMDFDGNSSINTAAAELMDTVFFCEKYASADSIGIDSPPLSFRWYLRNHQCVKACSDENGYSFERFDPAELAADIETVPVWNQLSKGIPMEPVTILQREAENIKASGKGQVHKKLVKEGMSEVNAELTEAAFLGKTNFCSFLFADLRKTRNSVYDLMFFGDRKGTIEMISTRAESGNILSFHSTVPEELKEKLHSLINRFKDSQGDM